MHDRILLSDGPLKGTRALCREGTPGHEVAAEVLVDSAGHVVDEEKSDGVGWPRTVQYEQRYADDGERSRDDDGFLVYEWVEGT